MDKNNNQIHTLKEYKEKYSKDHKSLLSFSKNQVETFDKKYKTEKDYLLKDRKWCLIGDRYFEIPSKASKRGWRNLSGGVRFALCALLGVTVAGAVGVTTYIVIKNNNSGIEIDPSTSKEVELGNITTDATYTNIPLILKVEDKIISDVSVSIGHYDLVNPDEYTYDVVSQLVKIKNEVINSKKGKVVITPLVLGYAPMTVTCDNKDIHNFDSNDVSKHQLIARNAKTGETITNATYYESPNCVITMDVDKGEFSVQGNAFDSVSVVISAEGYKPCIYEIEVASFEKLNKEQLLKGKLAKKDNDISGTVNMPNRYYDDSKGEWITGFTSIDKDSFINCNQVDSFGISRSITSIDASAFAGCSNITFKFNNENPNKNYSKSEDGTILFDKNKTTIISHQKTDGYVDIESYNTVTTIGANAYKGNTNITSILLPTNLNKIEPRAFEGCTNLGSVDFNDNTDNWIQIDGQAITIGTDETGKQANAKNLCEVGENAYNNWGYTGIKKAGEFDHLEFTRIGTTNTCSVKASTTGIMPANLIIPSKDPISGLDVVAIDFQAFINNKTIKTVTLPDSIISIGKNAFFGVDLTSVNFPKEGTWRVYDNVGIAEYMTQITSESAVERFKEQNKAFDKNVIKITAPKTEITKGYQMQLESSVADVMWSSSNPAIVSVDGNGYVTGQDVGEAYIYVDADEFELCGAIKITVK